ncbi:MAG: hypothetical protein J6X66_11225 [Lachnospiraceae bacterium]|nr:hypothetical protein [Lachnospiraceae bacterium]
MKEIWTVFILFWGSVADIRKKSVSAVYLIAAAVGSLIIILNSLGEPREILLGLIPGGIMLIAGRLSDSVGPADGVMLLILGAMYGLREGGELMMYSMLLAAVVSIFLIALKHAGKKDTLPFIPFLLAGFLLFRLRIFINGGG